MSTYKLALLLVICSSLVALGSSSADSCSFSIPSVDKPGMCDTYDLSKLASGLQTFEAGGYTYLMSLCGKIPETFIPKQCAQVNASFGPTVAYRYTNSKCRALGKLDNSFVFPVDASNSTVGLRLVYGKGQSETASSWTGAILYDLECNEEATNNKPLSVVEFPSFTYTVRWPSAIACPVFRATGECKSPVFDGTWEMVRYRPKPSWFDKVKFGIFIHWGIFSVPAFKNEWYWKSLMSGMQEYVEFHNKNYGCSGVQPDKYPCTGPSFTYADFAPMFKAELFQPDQWADLFKKAGAKYVVLTSKHHEGWCNFPNSYHWNWNSVDEGPGRDLVGDLTNSVRAAGLHMGLYHSLREWYHPLYIMDNEDNCSTTNFPDQVLIPTLKEMVEKYKPEVIWGDGSGDAPCTQDSIEYWKSPQFFSWLYNESPVKDTVLVNSRWGNPSIGDYESGEDRYTPGKLVPNKWESCYTIQKGSWGYDRTEGIDNFWDTTQLLQQLVSSVSCNGNLLLNVGPTADGRIVPAFEERLLEMGEWLNINGEAIYETVPWKYQNDTATQDIWYTATPDLTWPTVYAISFRAPTPGQDFVLKQAKPSDRTLVYLLGGGEDKLSFYIDNDGLHIEVPVLPLGSLQHAWVFKLLALQ